MVSVVGPGTPKGTLAFFNACMKQDLNAALPFHIKFTELYKDITSENEVAWFKACAELGGFKAGPPRTPYAPLDSSLRQDLASRLKELTEMASRSK